MTVTAQMPRRPRMAYILIVIIALPAFVAVWSGWVGLGAMTGFNEVHPLPGIADDWTINSAITLPVGIEAYAAFALCAWLAGPSWVQERTRRFGKISAVGSFLLGGIGQVAYHLLETANQTIAPTVVTVLVSVLPVGVVGMAAGLFHMLQHDHRSACEVVQREAREAQERDAIREERARERAAKTTPKTPPVVDSPTPVSTPVHVPADAMSTPSVSTSSTPQDTPVSIPARAARHSRVAIVSTPNTPQVDMSTPAETPAETTQDMTTAARIYRHRIDNPQATQQDVAEATEVSKRTVSRYWAETTPPASTQDATQSGHTS